MAVVLSAAKDLQLRSIENECRFFAALRKTAKARSDNAFQDGHKNPFTVTRGETG